MRSARWSFYACLGHLIFAGSACGTARTSGRASSEGGVAPATGCTPACVTRCSGAASYLCAPGSSPDDQDPALACTPPIPTAGGDAYCCFEGFGDDSVCVTDDALTPSCPDPGDYGYECSPGADPSTYDPTLRCGTAAPDPDGVHDDYCCGIAPAGCTLDSTLECVSGADGYACTLGSDPQTEQPGLSCSTPTLATGEDDYCCYSGGTWSATTCAPYDGQTSICPDRTMFAYQCESGDDPTSYDSMLKCNGPLPNVDCPHDDYCCTY